MNRAIFSLVLVLNFACLFSVAQASVTPQFIEDMENQQKICDAQYTECIKTFGVAVETCKERAEECMKPYSGARL